MAAAEREPIRHKSKLFERRGFAQIDESFAAGALIAHRARLPRAVVAYESLLSSPTAGHERERYRAVLWLSAAAAAAVGVRGDASHFLYTWDSSRGYILVRTVRTHATAAAPDSYTLTRRRRRRGARLEAHEAAGQAR